jgi:hypothetical protein
MGKAIRSVTKAISKIIPNEIKPILPYAALFIPGLQGVGGLLSQYGITNPMVQKMLISGATRGLTDSNAGFKDILRTGALAVAPDIIQSGLGSLGDYLNPITTEGVKGSIEAAKIGSNIMPAAQQTLTQQIGQLATQAANSDILTGLVNPQGLMQTAKAVALPSTVEYGAKAVDAAKKAKEDYERENANFQNFAGQQLADFNLGRRNSILGSLTRAGFAQDEIDATLAQLGLRNGGRVGAMNGGIMDVRRGLVEIPGGYSGNRYKQLLQLLEEAKAMGDMDKIKEVESDLFREYNKKENGGPVDGLKALKQKIKDYSNFKKEKRAYEQDDENYYNEREKKIQQRQFEDYKGRLYGIEAKNGGLMGLKMGGTPIEMDYRMGGFIPVGSKERADDVPARLSKNEFVMTADAVRAAGGGSVNEGAQRMYQLMNQLEGSLA